jgi:hypothetical protein
VQVGYHLTPFWSPTDRHPAAILDEAIEVVRATAQLGFEIYSLPPSPAERIEYLQMIAEEIVAPLRARASANAGARPV